MAEPIFEFNLVDSRANICLYHISSRKTISFHLSYLYPIFCNPFFKKLMLKFLKPMYVNNSEVIVVYMAEWCILHGYTVFLITWTVYFSNIKFRIFGMCSDLVHRVQSEWFSTNRIVWWKSKLEIEKSVELTEFYQMQDWHFRWALEFALFLPTA